MNIRIVKYGFYYNGFLYGWIDKKLYRLPFFNIKSKRSFDLREIKIIGNHYLISRNKVHFQSVKNRTQIINFELQIIIKSDIPF